MPKVYKKSNSSGSINNRKQYNAYNIDGVRHTEAQIRSLEEQIKKYKELNSVLDHHADSLAKQRDIMREVDALSEKTAKWTKQEYENAQKLVKEYRSMQRNDIFGKKTTQSDVSSIIGKINEDKNYNKNKYSSISNWYNTTQNEKFVKNAQEIYEYTRNHVYNQYVSQGKDMSDSKVIRQMREEINKNASEEILASSKNFGKFTNLFAVATQVFDKAVTTWKQVAINGINNQSNAFESTFENLSVRNGITRGQYYSAQNRLNNTLGSMGLYNNIASSEVQKMWYELGKNGIAIDMSTEEKRANITARAIETVLTGKIVPYLDTTSTTLQQFSEIEPTLMKQIRGIGVATMDMSGSSVVANRYLQDMIENLSPMAALAENELGTQFAKATGSYEALRAQGMSDYEIGEYMKSAESVYRNPYKALGSGNLDQQLAVIGAVQSGIDMADYGAMNSQYLKAVSKVLPMVPNNNMTPLFADLMPFSVSAMTTTAGVRNRYNLADAIAKGDLTGLLLNQYANKATSAYTNDQNQTNTQLQDITVENFMNALSVIDEWLGHWAKVITTAISAVGAIVLTNSVGSWIKGGLGKGAGQIPGQLSLFGSGGGSALLSTVGNVAGATTLIAGGSYLTYKGLEDIGSDIQSGKKLRTAGDVLEIAGGSTAAGVALAAGTTALAGGAGAGAAIAAAATNPIGWIALAVAAVGVGVKAYADATDTTVDLSQELNALKEQEMKTIKDSNQMTIDNMYDVRDAMKQATDYETAKNLALQAGIISQEDLVDIANNKTIPALLALADASISDQKELNKLAEITSDAYIDIAQEEKESAGNSILDIVNTAEAGGRGYKDLSEQEKKELNSFMQTYIRDNKNSDNEDIKWRIKQWGGAFDDDILSEDDFNKVFNGKNATTRDLFEYYVSSDTGAKSLSKNDNLSKYYGADQYYSFLSGEQVNDLVLQALMAQDIDSAKSRLRVLKNNDMPWDKIPKATQDRLIELFGEDIKSYRIGLSKVPYDNYLANLHEGEAVLTASTANELRNLIDVYRQSQNAYINMEAIVQAQTTALCAKIDEVITTINTGSPAGYNSGLASSVGQSMRAMSSLHGI